MEELVTVDIPEPKVHQEGRARRPLRRTRAREAPRRARTPAILGTPYRRAHRRAVRGRDAAGKGGTFTRITEALNPRFTYTVALGTPTEREKTQGCFQRHVAHLPAAGEIAMFDRSWYNRAGVERVMGSCTDAQYENFLRACPTFESILIRSGIRLTEYWFSVSPEEQERRFQSRIHNTTKRWKISPMDLASRARWVDYSRAKDVMFDHTDTKLSPWYVVPSDDKKRARLNCIRHLLSQFEYEDVVPGPIELPPRQEATGYIRPPKDEQSFVPDVYGPPKA